MRIVCLKKKIHRFNISVTIPSRFIIVSLLGQALSSTPFDILMAVVHQKAIAQESLKCTHPNTITASELGGGGVVEWDEGRFVWGMAKGVRVGEWGRWTW